MCIRLGAAGRRVLLMVSIDSISININTEPNAEYRCDRNLNLYKTPALEGLVTQAAAGRPFRILAHSDQALEVCLAEDDYPGWIAATNSQYLTVTEPPYQVKAFSAEAIQALIPQVIAFTQAAMATPNEYLWGGTVAPNYDCSGLMQAAFASVGVRLPRDSYQQEAFVTPVDQTDLIPGDLIFFGTPERTTHVGLHLGDGRYIHSSGKDQGRNGIGLDSLTDLSDPVSQRYFEQLRICGRVVKSYQPQPRKKLNNPRKESPVGN